MAHNEKLVFVFIPGACHMPEVFNPLRQLMSQQELDSEVVALPSVGAEPPNKSLTDDVSHVRSVLQQLAEEGRLLVVVAHSYGGLVGAGAVQGLDYVQRSQSGQTGGVIMLVYMTALVAPSGNSLYDMIGGKWFPWIKVKVVLLRCVPSILLSADPYYTPYIQGDYCYTSDEEIVFYNDLSPDEQKKWISKLKHISVSALMEPVTNEPWHNLACMYILCEKDMCLPIALQEQFASTLGRGCILFRCQGSHSPFLSMPNKIIEGLELAAKVGAERHGLASQSHI